MSSSSSCGGSRDAQEDARSNANDSDGDDDMPLRQLVVSRADKHAQEQAAASAKPLTRHGQPSHVGGKGNLERAFCLCPGPPGCTAKCDVGSDCPNCLVNRVLPNL